MKAIVNVRWQEEPLEKHIADMVVEHLDDVDFYDGRDVERVLKDLLASYGNLINVLAERGAIHPEDMHRIVPGMFVDAFDEDDD